MNRQTLLLLSGIALIAWNGAALNTHLRLAGWRGAELALFALGLMLVGRGYTERLERRIAQLEATLRVSQAAKTSPQL